jgi:tryptophanyl-tRNA synthetase
MYTDPNHLKATDPGVVEGNPVFAYLDAFDLDKDGLSEMKEHYRRGGLGDVKVKSRLQQVLTAELDPIRARRQEFAKAPDFVFETLQKGTAEAQRIAAQTLLEVRAAMHIDYYPS